MADPVVARLNAALEGRYAVERELGEGGMAVVYLADDLRHERKVAIKVLKPDLAVMVGAERFLTEIKTTANLQHPHILPLFDSGEADGFVFYVMPYVEGESLRQRLDRDVQLPVEEAVRLATGVANALGYAHRQGIIHRDVKPENVLLHEGEPLVADFGIALAVTAAGGSRLTETGLSLGTPYYMSPEQASADRELGPQADIYSVGCMLYEMLVGDPPHTGKSAQAVLAKILTERPRAVTEVRATVPAHVASAVARALERLPADRFETAEDFVRALGDPGFRHVLAVTTRTQPVPASAPSSARPSISRFLPWGVAAASLAVAAWSLIPEPAPPSGPTVRMTLSDFVVESAQGGGWRVAISRDGSTIVAGGADDLLYVRRSDDPEFRPIAGTENGRNFSISPDREWVVFSQEGMLRKVQLAGGPVLPVASSDGSAHWYDPDAIVFASDEGIVRVAASGGGEPTVLVVGGGGRPHMLPGERGLIMDLDQDLVVHDLETGENVLVAEGGSNGRYLPTGHILYGDRSVQSVFAVPFDTESMRVTGGAVPVLPSVNIFSGGAVQLAVSDNGTLVHGLSVEGGGGGVLRLVWVGMDGSRTELPLDLAATFAFAPRLSPDGRVIAYYDGASAQIHTYDVQTGARTPLTDAVDTDPRTVWSSDGTGVYYAAEAQDGTEGWFRVAADGSGRVEEVASGMPGSPTSVSPDGEWMVGESAPSGSPDIFRVRLSSSPVAAEAYLRADWHEEEGVIAPDGRWLAYASADDGPHRIRIRSFPEPGPAYVVSSGPGGSPVWSPEGDALYYEGGDAMWRRDVRLGETVELGEERRLFSTAGLNFSVRLRNFDLAPDGDRFLFVSTVGSASSAPPDSVAYEGIGPVVVVVNWFEELRERMGEGR